MAAFIALLLRLLATSVAISVAMNCDFSVCPADPNCSDGTTYCDPATEICKPGGGGLLGECDTIEWETIWSYPAVYTETYITGTYTETTTTYTNYYTYYEDSDFSVTELTTVIETETDVETVPGPTVTETVEAARHRRHRMFRRDTVTYVTSYYDPSYCYSVTDAIGCTATVEGEATEYTDASVDESVTITNAQGVTDIETVTEYTTEIATVTGDAVVVTATASSDIPSVFTSEAQPASSSDAVPSVTESSSGQASSTESAEPNQGQTSESAGSSSQPSHPAGSPSQTPSAALPTNPTSASSILLALQTAIPSIAQDDPDVACFLASSQTSSYPTPSWYSALPTAAQSYYSALHAGETGSCTSGNNDTAAASGSGMSTGEKAGAGVGAIAGAAALASLLFLALKRSGHIGQKKPPSVDEKDVLPTSVAYAPKGAQGPPPPAGAAPSFQAPSHAYPPSDVPTPTPMNRSAYPGLPQALAAPVGAMGPSGTPHLSSPGPTNSSYVSPSSPPPSWNSPVNSGSPTVSPPPGTPNAPYAHSYLTPQPTGTSGYPSPGQPYNSGLPINSNTPSAPAPGVNLSLPSMVSPPGDGVTGIVPPPILFPLIAPPLSSGAPSDTRPVPGPNSGPGTQNLPARQPTTAPTSSPAPSGTPSLTSPTMTSPVDWNDAPPTYYMPPPSGSPPTGPHSAKPTSGDKSPYATPYPSGGPPVNPNMSPGPGVQIDPSSAGHLPASPSSGYPPPGPGIMDPGMHGPPPDQPRMADPALTSPAGPGSMGPGTNPPGVKEPTPGQPRMADPPQISPADPRTSVPGMPGPGNVNNAPISQAPPFNTPSNPSAAPSHKGPTPGQPRMADPTQTWPTDPGISAPGMPGPGNVNNAPTSQAPPFNTPSNPSTAPTSKGPYNPYNTTEPPHHDPKIPGSYPPDPGFHAPNTNPHGNNSGSPTSIDPGSYGRPPHGDSHNAPSSSSHGHPDFLIIGGRYRRRRSKEENRTYLDYSVARQGLEGGAQMPGPAARSDTEGSFGELPEGQRISRRPVGSGSRVKSGDITGFGGRVSEAGGAPRFETDGLQRYETDGMQRYETEGMQRYETDGRQRFETDGNARYEMGYGGENSGSAFGAGVRRRNRSSSREDESSRKRRGIVETGWYESGGRRA